ncbi:MAG: glycosyltransferase [Oscillospiraceae bacterium]|nr:glycosyltransferase [Oscillospiraceae bacterium]
MKISVVVTFYNCEKYVKDCMESLLLLDYDDYEIIILDDGSSDQTRALVQEYVDIHHLKYAFHEHQGVSAARNKGIALADGEYVMFVDGDDRLDASSLKEMAQYTTEHTDIIACTCTAFDDENYTYQCHFFEGDRTFQTASEKEELLAQLLDVSYGQEKYKVYTAIGVPWGKLYRRQFLLEHQLQFEPRLIRMQDNVFNMNAFYYANKIIYIDKPLYMYRITHIISYKIKPELVYRVLDSRNQFFTAHPEVFTKRIQQMYDSDCIGFLANTMKFYAEKKSQKNFLVQFKEWSDKSICAKVLKNPPKLPFKRRTLIFLMQKKQGKLLYLFLKNRKH